MKKVTVKAFLDKQILAEALWINGVIDQQEYSNVLAGKEDAMFTRIHDAMIAISNNEYGTGE